MKIPVGGIAFFDSGVGGLTVLDCCQKRFTNEKFYYFGDNERAPYGNQPPDLIRRYVDESFSVFKQLEIKAVVLACNTVTALCIDELRARYPFPIIGAEPAVVSAAKRGGEVFVLTTRATFNSTRFHALCAKVRLKYPQAHITPYSCDGLAGGIEERLTDEFYDFTRFLPRGSPNAVVLGCTHYLYIKEKIKNFYGCEVFDGNEGIAQRLYNQLARQNYAKKEETDGVKGKNLQRGRDGRPPVQKGCKKIGKIDHFLASNSKTGLIARNTNECSRLKARKSLVISGIATKNEVYFLGSGASKNKQFYERMFVF